MKLTDKMRSELDRELQNELKHELFHEVLPDVDDEIDSEIEWNMNCCLRLNQEQEDLCDEDDDEEDFENFLLNNPRMPNEFFLDKLDDGMIFDHNFMFEKLEWDREDGNIEGELLDIREMYGTEGLDKFLETGNPEED